MFVLIGQTKLQENLNEDRAKLAKNYKNAKTKRWLEYFFLFFARSRCTGLQIAREGFRNRTFRTWEQNSLFLKAKSLV